jgi:hypothetical protein
MVAVLRLVWLRREVGKGEPLTRMRPEVAPFFVGNWAAIEDATVR